MNSTEAASPIAEMSSVHKERVWLDVLGVGARWILGCVFIYMGLTKVAHPEQFLKLIRQYDAISQPFVLNSIGALLPWFEIWCGVFLLAGIAVRGAALNVVLMLIPFTVLILKRALAVASAQSLAFCAVKFDCGCGNGEVVICHKLVENCGLILLALFVVAGFGRRLCVRHSLFGASA